MSPQATSSAIPARERARALRILAHTIVRELDHCGYSLCDIATLASELIGLGCALTRSRRQAVH
jgi:hypothetical protein